MTYSVTSFLLKYFHSSFDMTLLALLLSLWFLFDFLTFFASPLLSNLSLNFRDSVLRNCLSYLSFYTLYLLVVSSTSIGLTAFNIPINPTFLSLKQTPSPLFFSFYFNCRLIYPSVSLRHPQRWIRKLLNLSYLQMNVW